MTRAHCFVLQAQRFVKAAKKNTVTSIFYICVNLNIKISDEGRLQTTKIKIINWYWPNYVKIGILDEEGNFHNFRIRKFS